jgi:hypothetical protein
MNTRKGKGKLALKSDGGGGSAWIAKYERDVACKNEARRRQ